MQHNVDLTYDIWQTTPAPNVVSTDSYSVVVSVTRELSFGTRPSKLPSFGTRGAVLAPVSIFERLNKNKFISMKQNGNLTKFQQLLFYTFPPAQLPLLLINIIFFWPYKQWAPEPLLGCQNFDGRVPKVSYRVTLATSGAGVVCHIYKKRHAFCTICIAI